jgi:D-3-phosphoglycerate dehydrogenase
MKILISDPIEQQCVDILKSNGFEVDVKTGLPAAELKKIIGEYAGLLVRSSTKVTAEIIGAATNLRIIGRAGAGVDNIDTPAATRRGIIVMNTPGGNTISTAEHTMSLMLSLARNIAQADLSMKKGEWKRKDYVGVELYEKTLGVLGVGKVGKEVAIRAMSFGMKVLAYDPLLSPDAAKALGFELVDVDTLVKRSDFITVHTPLIPETKGILGERAFANCKRGVRIINCARGGIVDEKALLDALNAGIVGGAALDVYESEPPGATPLVSHPRVIATPHLGASTEEAQEKVAIQIAYQVSDALLGKGIVGSVNADVITSASRADIQPYLMLAERLGSLAVQLMDGTMSSLTLRAHGAKLAESAPALSAAFFKGMLAGRLEEEINYINAPVIAKERGMHLAFDRDHDHELYADLLTVKYETEKEKRTFSGTIFGNAGMRLVRIDGFAVDAVLEGHILFYSNIDRPGVVARVSSILAEAGVNIAGMSLGRYGQGGNALTMMAVDTQISQNVLGKISRVDGLLGVKTVIL